MKKIDYRKPAVRVKFVMIQAPLCGESIPKSEDEGEDGPFSKDADFEDGLVIPSSKSVWDD